MRDSRMLRFFCLSVLFVVFAAPLFAQEDGATKSKKKKLPPSGSLSSSGTLGTGSHAIGLPWGAADPIRGGSPVSGSVSKLSDSKWILRLFNNSKDSYDVNLEVTQYNDKRARIKTDHYSYKLGPKEKAERQLSTTKNVSFAELALKNWKKVASAADSKEKQAAGAQAGGAGGSAPVKPQPTVENEEDYLGNMGYQGN